MNADMLTSVWMSFCQRAQLDGDWTHPISVWSYQNKQQREKKKQPYHFANSADSKMIEIRIKLYCEWSIMIILYGGVSAESQPY